MKAVSARGERAYLLLAGIFLGALVLTNLIAGKFFLILGQPLSCGIIAYPITFLATDLISEVYGERRAREVVKVGFLISLFVTAVVWIAVHAPTAPETYVDEASFRRVFGLTPGVVLGSMCAYLVAQFVDVRIFEFWRGLTRGRWLWLRNNGSTMLSQMLDTLIVVTMVLVVWPRIDGDPETAPIGLDSWRAIVIGQYLFKAAIALSDTPFFYAGTALLRSWTGIPNPFLVGEGAASAEAGVRREA